MPNKSRRKTSHKIFSPDSKQIDEAVKKFLNKGGKVTCYPESDEEFDPFVVGTDHRAN